MSMNSLLKYAIRGNGLLSCRDDHTYNGFTFGRDNWAPWDGIGWPIIF